MQRLLKEFLTLARANNHFSRVTFCLIISIAIAGALLVIDKEYLHGSIELMLIFQLAALIELYFSARTFLNESEVQLVELDIRNRKVTSLNTRIINLVNSMTQTAVITTDSKNRITLFSSGAERLFGVNQNEALYEHYDQVVRTEGEADDLSTSAEDPGSPVELIFYKKDGSKFMGEFRCAQIFDADSGELERINVIVDVSERVSLLRKIEESNDFLRHLTQRIPNALYQYQFLEEGNSYFTYFSPSIEQLIELRPEDVVGMKFIENPFFKLVHEDDVELILAATKNSMMTGGNWSCSFRVKLPTKGLRWLYAESYAEKSVDQAYVWYGSLIDITESKARESALEMQSITDELTGAYNRRHFMETLNKQVALCGRVGANLSVIMLDIDRFKSINDHWGHECGDIVLKRTCALIDQRLRSHDVLCRIGGEEFVIICPSTDLNDAAMLAESLRQLLESQIIEPVGQVTASFGVAAWKKGFTGEVLLRKADEETYRSKRQGRNCVHVHGRQ